MFLMQTINIREHAQLFLIFEIVDQLPQDDIIMAQGSRAIKLIRTLPANPTNKFTLRKVIRNI